MMILLTQPSLAEEEKDLKKEEKKEKKIETIQWTRESARTNARPRQV